MPLHPSFDSSTTTQDETRQDAKDNCLKCVKLLSRLADTDPPGFKNFGKIRRTVLRLKNREISMSLTATVRKLVN